ncbi:MAG TPA: patatin-like phospholipase family protein, partial [Thermodesulfobacteriota bacterium]|nr:patatin-like phospholipase family protein [Thermodesulfobacteriota bacterium]
MSRLFKMGVALGGGGARGLAHLGVLCALEREGIPIDLLAGSSMGALVGAVYALDPRAAPAVEHFRRYLGSKEFQRSNPEFLHEHDHGAKPFLEGIFHRFATFIKKGYFYSQSLTKSAPVSEEGFAENINFLIEPVDIESTRIPLVVTALDLKTGKEVVLQQGPLRKAVSASCAIPGILPPVLFNEWQLVDGGMIDQVPVSPLRNMGADLVIGVDVADDLSTDRDFETGFDIVLRTYDICQRALSEYQIREADVVLRPDVSW